MRDARRKGLRFTVETTTPYLGIASDDPNGFLVKMVPPVRTKDHHDALWQGLLLELAWAGLFLVMTRWFYRRGLRRYSAYGG